eukprot:jgi/Picre1/30040/NNA_005412.t1
MGTKRRPGGPRKKKADIENEEIETIENVLKQQIPPSGSDTLAAKASHATQGHADRPFWLGRKFQDFPLSQYTKDALKKAKFTNLTAIQRAALPHALVGRDVLGAAKTGSGKTLAFLIPVIEKLYRLKWNVYDGLGALIISPTRELALQIFEELRTIGCHHELSAGLLIGGKDVEQEASRVGVMNILVATPGRLLQHMDESPDFNADGLKLLVLDEADRILDMGFSATVNAILANVPKDRQTLLFSATQTKSVSALARLSLKDPEYVSAHADAAAPTPVKLEQAYMICNLQDKMDEASAWNTTAMPAWENVTAEEIGCIRSILYSKAGVLFATDIAARGLDFPKVDWVVQADCPEDVASYIHRVGRTARYTHGGKGLLLLVPSECEGMVRDLKESKVELKNLKYNKEKIQPVSQALQALLSKDAEVKTAAQKAVVSYLRSVFLQPKKHIFDVQKLPATEFAFSLGLTSVPKMKILAKGEQQQETEEATEVHPPSEKLDQRSTKNNIRTNTTTSTSADDDEADDGDFLVLKRKHSVDDTTKGDDDDDDDEQEAQNGRGPSTLAITTSKKKKKKMKINVNKTTGQKVIFDEEGKALDPLEALAADVASQDATHHFASVEERAAATQKALKERDAIDKEEMKRLRKMKRQEKRARRLARENEEYQQVSLTPYQTMTRRPITSCLRKRRKKRRASHGSSVHGNATDPGRPGSCSLGITSATKL